jgi:hypothetical protein
VADEVGYWMEHLLSLGKVRSPAVTAM